MKTKEKEESLKDIIHTQLQSLLEQWVMSKVEKDLLRKDWLGGKKTISFHLVEKNTASGWEKATSIDKSEVFFFLEKGEMQSKPNQEDVVESKLHTVPAGMEQSFVFSTNDSSTSSRESSKSKTTNLGFGLGASLPLGASANVSAGREWSLTTVETNSKTTTVAGEQQVTLPKKEQDAEYKLDLIQLTDRVFYSCKLNLKGAVKVIFKRDHKAVYNDSTRAFEDNRNGHSECLVNLGTIIKELVETGKLLNSEWHFNTDGSVTHEFDDVVVNNVKSIYPKWSEVPTGIANQTVTTLHNTPAPVISSQQRGVSEASSHAASIGFVLSYKSSKIDVVVELGAAKHLPKNIQAALARRVEGNFEDPNFKYVVDQLKTGGFDKEIKSQLSQTICTMLLQKKSDPNLEMTLQWLKENPDRCLKVDYVEQGVVFSGTGGDEILEVEEETVADACNRERGQFKELLDKKLAVGYKFELKRDTVNQLLIVCTQTEKGTKKVQTSLIALQEQLIEYLAAGSLLINKEYTLGELDEAENETLCIKTQEVSDMGTIVDLLRGLIKEAFPKYNNSQSLFSCSDTGVVDAEKATFECVLQ